MKALLKAVATLCVFCLALAVTAQEEEAVGDTAVVQEAAEPGYKDLLRELTTVSSATKKEQLIKAMASSDPRRSALVLTALLGGDLFVVEDDTKHIVIGKKNGRELDIFDAVTDEKIGTVSKRDLDKIRINNKLRGVLRGTIAELELFSDDRSMRLKSAKDLVKNPEPRFIESINRALANETDKEVLEQLNIAAAVIQIKTGDELVRLRAIETLSGSLNTEAMAILGGLTLKNADGEFLEPNPKVRAAAKSALKKIQSKVEFYGIVENVFFGLSLGSVLLLAAVGLAITFGVMGVINMAHGEMMMLGAYTTYVVQLLMPNHIESSVIVAIPAAFLVAGIVGVLIERTVIRHLYGRPLETLLATFGISLILQQAVRSIFSPLNRQVITPEWMSGSWQINGLLSFTYNRLYIIIFSLIVLLGLVFLLRQTLIGLQMRAVTQNRAMANSMGIRSSWVDALTFGLGSGIAGMAGVALSQLTNVGPNLGQNYIIDSFMVVVFGGVGNLFGTFFAAMSLGVVNKFLEPFAGAVLGKILVLIFIILFIQWRPRGMFALKGRFVED